MRKALKRFDNISRRINEYNRQNGVRYFRLQDTDKNGRIISFGVYDSLRKKYAVFETINFSGNFRYDSNEVPAEVFDMETIVYAK